MDRVQPLGGNWSRWSSACIACRGGEQQSYGVAGWLWKATDAMCNERRARGRLTLFCLSGGRELVKRWRGTGITAAASFAVSTWLEAFTAASHPPTTWQNDSQHSASRHHRSRPRLANVQALVHEKHAVGNASLGGGDRVE